MLAAADVTIETIRPDGSRQMFSFADRRRLPRIGDEIPEPHAFVARVRLMQAGQAQMRELNSKSTIRAWHGEHHRDNNMRAALVHVMADAAVSVLVIVGLLLARDFGWLWMDPLAGIIGALVIANWSVGLLRDTGAILLDRMPDPRMAEKVREPSKPRATGSPICICGGSGPAISAPSSRSRQRGARGRTLPPATGKFADLSHVTVEVQHAASAPG